MVVGQQRSKDCEWRGVASRRLPTKVEAEHTCRHVDDCDQIIGQSNLFGGGETCVTHLHLGYAAVVG